MGRWKTLCVYAIHTEFENAIGWDLGLSSQPAVRRPAREADDVSAAGGGKAYRCSLKVVSQRHRHVNVAVGSCGHRIATVAVVVTATVVTGRRRRRGRRRGRLRGSGGAELDDADGSGRQCRVRPATPEPVDATVPLFEDLKGPFQIVVDPKIQIT